MLATEVAEERDARRPRCLIALVVLMTSIAFATTLPADAAATTIERCFLDKINEARADVGAAPLSWAPHIEDYTREHSEDMAGWGELIHSTGDALSAAIPPVGLHGGRTSVGNLTPTFPIARTCTRRSWTRPATATIC